MDAHRPATAHIDEALERFAHRQLIAGSEVVDFLLDLRAVVTADAVLALLELQTVG
jgi:hypothetical protein